MAQGGGAASGAPTAVARGAVGALSHALLARALLASHAVRLIGRGGPPVVKPEGHYCRMASVHLISRGAF